MKLRKLLARCCCMSFPADSDDSMIMPVGTGANDTPILPVRGCTFRRFGSGFGPQVRDNTIEVPVMVGSHNLAPRTPTVTFTLTVPSSTASGTSRPVVFICEQRHSPRRPTVAAQSAVEVSDNETASTVASVGSSSGNEVVARGNVAAKSAFTSRQVITSASSTSTSTSTTTTTVQPCSVTIVAASLVSSGELKLKTMKSARFSNRKKAAPSIPRRNSDITGDKKKEEEEEEEKEKNLPRGPWTDVPLDDSPSAPGGSGPTQL